MSTGALARGLAFAAAVTATSSSPAIGQSAALSAWVGAASDDFEALLPASPQVAFRVEVPRLQVRPGVEIALRLVSQEASCIDACDGTAPTIAPSLSALVRAELAVPGRPYLIGMLGRAFTTQGLESSMIWGGGAGLRLARLLGFDDVSLEGRYRRDERYSSFVYDHFEAMVGFGL